MVGEERDAEEKKGQDENFVVAKRKPQGWKCMPFIIGNETFEKAASFGVAANLTVYLVKRFHMGQLQAANITNIFFGTTNFAPLLGAFISDTYLGRFQTLAYGSFASLLGMVGMTLSSSVAVVQPGRCGEGVACESPSSLQVGVLYLSLGLLTVGAGAIRPCSLPFGVDQFDQSQSDPESLRGLNSYFNWYYGTTTAALVFAMTILVYIQNDVSWEVGFGIPTFLMLLSILLFFVGTTRYVHVPPEGSIFSGIARVFVASFRKRKLRLPSEFQLESQSQSLLYNPPTQSHRIFRLPLTSQFRFLNKGAVVKDGDINSDGSPTNSWELCSVQQIEETKCLIRIVPVWISGVLCFVALAQQFTFVILQTLTMDRHLGPHFEIPAGSIVSVSFMVLTMFIPIYDRVLVPLAMRYTGVEGGITLLQRQGIGLVISPMSMVVAGIVERKRRNSALANGGVSPMSVFWLAPQLILMGIAEAFNAVGQIEFYNKQFPEHMQTLAGSLFFCSLGGSNYLSSALAGIVKKATTTRAGDGDGHTSWLADNINLAKVDYFYYVIAVMGILNLLYFLLCSHYYRYKGMPSPAHSHVAEPDKIHTEEEAATPTKSDIARDAYTAQSVQV